MDITNTISTEFVEFHSDTPVSKAKGAFEDSDVKAVNLSNDDEFDGVVTRRQLAVSHHQPNEKVGSLVWHVPKITPDEDIREVAQLMIESDSWVLPVFDGRQISGVVKAD